MRLAFFLDNRNIPPSASFFSLSLSCSLFSSYYSYLLRRPHLLDPTSLPTQILASKRRASSFSFV